MAESKPEQTELSIQDLPRFPTAEQMEDWSKEKVLQWIQQRHRNILEDDDLNNFNKARIGGRAFVLSSFDFFNKNCGLSPGASLGLSGLVNEIKEGKFIPWT